MKIPESIRRYAWLVIFLAFIFTFDWITPYELSVGPLYLLSVAYARWQVGFGAGLATALINPCLWALADYGSGHRYSHPWLLLENASVRCLTYLLTFSAVSLYKKTLEAHRRRLAMLERLLSVCPGCGAIGVNQGGWRKASEFHQEPAELFTLCPTCAAAYQTDGPNDTPRAAHD